VGQAPHGYGSRVALFAEQTHTTPTRRENGAFCVCSGVFDAANIHGAVLGVDGGWAAV
jgi:hypothetical protein